MRLTDRDRQVVQAVNDCRVLTQDQLERLFFGSQTRAQARLWLLWQHGFLRREFLPVRGGIQNSPTLYVLDARGAELLQSDLGYNLSQVRYSRKPLSYPFLQHTLGLNDIRIAIVLACQRRGYALKTWLDERDLKADYDKVRVGSHWVAVIPDGYFAVRVLSGVVHFFLEFDRGPERLAVFRRKVEAYLAYYRGGGMASRFGTDRIRVLTVTEGGESLAGRERLANVKAVTEQAGGRSRFWFSSLEQVMGEDALAAPIWQVAGRDEPVALIR